MVQTSWKQKTYVFYHRHKLHKNKLTLVLKLKSSITHQHPSNHYLSANVLNFHPVIEFNYMRVKTKTATLVQTNRNTRLNRTILLITTTQHVISRHRRMMTYLLKINRTTVNPSLVSLTQNRIERLFHVNRKRILSHHDNNRVFHSFKRVSNSSCLLSKNRRIEVSPCNRL